MKNFIYVFVLLPFFAISQVTIVDNTDVPCCCMETQIWKVDPDFTLSALNPSFENFLNGETGPVLSPAGFKIINENNIEGWSTTPENVIEVWADGFQGVPAYDGDYFIEMNASTAGRLSQRLAVPNGKGLLTWQVAHRARGNAATINSAEVIIGIVDPVTGLVTDNIVETMVSNGADWTVYTGTFDKPCGILEVELAFNSVIPATGGTGNFLDDVRLGYKKFLTNAEPAFQDCCGSVYEDDCTGDPLDPDSYTLTNPNCFSDEGGENTQNTVISSDGSVTIDDNNLNAEGEIEYDLSVVDECAEITVQGISQTGVVGSTTTTTTYEDECGNTFQVSYTNTDRQSTVVSADGSVTITPIINTNGVTDYNLSVAPYVETTRVIYSEEYFANSTNGITQASNRNLAITRNSVGLWTAIFSTPHPDGINYHVSGQAEEQFGNRDAIDFQIVQGTKSAAGFQFTLTTGDNGGTADILVDTPFSIAIDAPVTVLIP